MSNLYQYLLKSDSYYPGGYVSWRGSEEYETDKILNYSLESILPHYYDADGDGQFDSGFATKFTGSVQGVLTLPEDPEEDPDHETMIFSLLRESDEVDFRVSFSDVIDLDFQDVTGQSVGEIIFSRANIVQPDNENNENNENNEEPITQAVAINPDWKSSIPDFAGDIFLSADDNHSVNSSIPFAYSTLIEEISHALGITHPLNSAVDNKKLTITSYNSHPDMASTVEAKGLQLYDILALQQLYGSENTTRLLGDTVYAINNTSLLHGGAFGQSATSAFLYTIWDAGGDNDTIDATGYLDGVQIDLREGHFSSIGKSGFGNNAVAWDTTNYDAGNVAIAYGTVIENAIGTAQKDDFIGNDADNRFVGGDGGDDINGGNGYDTVDYSGDGAGITANLTTLSVVDGFEETDTLENIEHIVGTDHGDTFEINQFDGNNPQATPTSADFTSGTGDDTIKFNWLQSQLDEIDYTSSSKTLDASISYIYNGGNDKITGGSDYTVSVHLPSGINLTDLTWTVTDLPKIWTDPTDVALSTSDSLEEWYLMDYVVSITGHGTITVEDQFIIKNREVVFTPGTSTPPYFSGEYQYEWKSSSQHGPELYSYSNDGSKITYKLEQDGIGGIPYGGTDFSNLDPEDFKFEVSSTEAEPTTISGSRFKDEFTLSGRSIGYADQIELFAGNDTITATTFNDDIDLGDGNDIAHGGNGFDEIYGGKGNDTINGDAGNDVLTGGSGTDTLNGGADNDILHASVGADILDGGTGTDTVVFSDIASAVTVDLSAGTAVHSGTSQSDTISNIENIIGSHYADTITGDSVANYLAGGKGHDIIYGDGGSDQLLGGDGNDTISGGDGLDQIHGDRGNDNISGNDGNDSIWSGSGNDTLTGGADIDTIHGEEGNDTIRHYVSSNLSNADYYYAGTGLDTLEIYFDTEAQYLSFETELENYKAHLRANSNTTSTNLSVTTSSGIVLSDFERVDSFVAGQLHRGHDDILGKAVSENIFGTANSEQFSAFAGNDSIYAGGGNDTVYAGEGNDRLVGDEGDDTLYGETGSDRLIGGVGDDTLDGGDGLDVADYSAAANAVHVNLHNGVASDDGDGGSDTLVSIEDVTGSAGNDTLVGSTDDNILRGEDGDDLIYGYDGDDTLYGGEGNDDLRGQGGIDTYYGGNGNDFILGGQGDIAYGEAGDDVIRGYGGTGLFDGGAGTDRVWWRDYYHAGNVGLTVDLAAGTATDGDNNVATLVSIENITGSSYNDILHGDNNINIIRGGGNYNGLTDGDDTIYGYGGNDKLYGDAGVDTIYGGDGDDTISGNAGNDILHGGDGVDYITGDEGDDTIYAGAGNDEIYAGAGLDTVYGGDGNDTLWGEEDADILFGDDGADYLYGYGDNDALSGGAGIDYMYGGDGNDTLTFDQDSDRMYGNAGADTFIAEEGSNLDHAMSYIYDFAESEDHIDVSDLLGGYNSATDTLSDFVNIAQGYNTTIQIDRDGAGTAHGWDNVVRLQGNTTIGTNVDQLVLDGTLIV